MNRKAKHTSVILQAISASVLVMMLAPAIAFAQFGLFPFNSTPEVLPTYISLVLFLEPHLKIVYFTIIPRTLQFLPEPRLLGSTTTLASHTRLQVAYLTVRIATGLSILVSSHTPPSSNTP